MSLGYLPYDPLWNKYSRPNVLGGGEIGSKKFIGKSAVTTSLIPPDRFYNHDLETLVQTPDDYIVDKTPLRIDDTSNTLSPAIPFTRVLLGSLVSNTPTPCGEY